MKINFFTPVLALILLVFSACEKTEITGPEITFKKGIAYVSSDVILKKDSNVIIGITASKTENTNLMNKFNISKSVNGGSDTTIFQKDLSGSEADNYSYDLPVIVGTKVGNKEKYTFTVTNRDGLIGQKSLTITIK